MTQRQARPHKAGGRVVSLFVCRSFDSQICHLFIFLSHCFPTSSKAAAAHARACHTFSNSCLNPNHVFKVCDMMMLLYFTEKVFLCVNSWKFKRAKQILHKCHFCHLWQIPCLLPAVLILFLTPRPSETIIWYWIFERPIKNNIRLPQYNYMLIK